MLKVVFDLKAKSQSPDSSVTGLEYKGYAVAGMANAKVAHNHIKPAAFIVFIKQCTESRILLLTIHAPASLMSHCPSCTAMHFRPLGSSA